MSQFSARRPRVAAPLRFETLEDRLTPSWGGLPPSSVALPTDAVSVALNATGDIKLPAAIAATETDWYRFTAAAGDSVFRTTTPRSDLDTVLGVYDAAGQLVASNDDISGTNTDSRVKVNLKAGTYYLGVTNFDGTGGGTYTVSLNTPTPPVAPPTDTSFSIALRTTGLTPSQLVIFQAAVARWEQAIVGDLPDATYNGVAVDDLLIDASAAPWDGPGGILGGAGPDAVRPGGLTTHGTMTFDSDDIANMEANGSLRGVVMHEIGHILGVGTLWGDRLTGNGTTDPRFTGPQAVAEYSALTGRAETGVPVESGGGPGTRYSHWSESVFQNELMTGYASGDLALSRMTIASMADLGYRVNLSAADAYTLPPQANAVAASRATGSGATGSGANLVAASYGNVAFDLTRDRTHTPGDNWNGVLVG